jgi:hypothetical protein
MSRVANQAEPSIGQLLLHSSDFNQVNQPISYHMLLIVFPALHWQFGTQ